MRNGKAIHRRELLQKVQACAQEMERLSALHDRAAQPKRDEIFDRMTELRNKAMDLLQKAHGRRSKPIKIRLSPKRAV